jgi:hypothetical protein
VKRASRTLHPLVAFGLFLVRKDCTVEPRHHAVDGCVEVAIPAHNVNVPALQDNLRASLLPATFRLVLPPFSGQGNVDARRFVKMFDNRLELLFDIGLEGRRHTNMVSTDGQIHSIVSRAIPAWKNSSMNEQVADDSTTKIYKSEGFYLQIIFAILI